MNLLKSLLTYLYDDKDQTEFSDRGETDRLSLSDDQSTIDTDDNNDGGNRIFCREGRDSGLLNETTLPGMDNLKQQQ